MANTVEGQGGNLSYEEIRTLQAQDALERANETYQNSKVVNEIRTKDGIAKLYAGLSKDAAKAVKNV